MSPELAADLGLGWPAAHPDPNKSGAASALQGMACQALPTQDSTLMLDEGEQGEKEVEGGEACLVLGPSPPPQRRRSSLLRASQALMHKMAQQQGPEQDAMSQLVAADMALAAVESGRSSSSGSGARGLSRTASDARHLAEVLESGSEIMSRANQASSAWRTMQQHGRAPERLGPAVPAGALPPPHIRHSGGGGLSPIAEGNGAGGLTAPPAGRTTGEHSSPSRIQRKSILGQPGLAGGNSSASLVGGAGGLGPRGNTRTSLALPHGGGASGVAARRWEEEQEAELAEVGMQWMNL
jgi:hypothetical protein